MKRANIDKAEVNHTRLAESTSGSRQALIAQAGHLSQGVAIPFAIPAKLRVGGQLRGQITESADCWRSDA